MAKLPIINSEKMIKALELEGFVKTRQKGSHQSLHKKTAEGIKLVVVPQGRDVPRGTLRGILRKADISREKFFELLGKL